MVKSQRPAQTVRLLFADTAKAIKDRSQTVTRRFGAEYVDLAKGDIIEAVSDGWMLSCPVRVPLLARLEIVAVSLEPLRRLTEDLAYAERELQLEGIPPYISPRSRVGEFFIRHRAVTLDSLIVRIEFRHIESDHSRPSLGA